MSDRWKYVLAVLIMIAILAAIAGFGFAIFLWPNYVLGAIFVLFALAVAGLLVLLVWCAVLDALGLDPWEDSIS